MWGLDSVGPFRTAPGSYRHILVAVDKFTKWIEVRPIVKVTSEEAAKFIGDITHRFGVPNRIITDLGTTFNVLPSRISIRTTPTTFTTPRSPTLGATARSSVPMAWSFRLSKIASMMTPQTTPPDG
jgi:hypothetical protein